MTRSITILLILFGIGGLLHFGADTIYAQPAIDSGTGYSVEAPQNSRRGELIESYTSAAKDIYDFIQNISNSSSPTENDTQAPITGEDTPENPSLNPTFGPVTDTPVNIISDSNFSQSLIQNARRCLANQAVYEQASSMTGIPWMFLAGVHHVEGGCSPTKSLVSGRAIGIAEPDVGSNCSSQYDGVGKPHPVAGGCGFSNLLDTAVYAGNHLIGKIGTVPRTLPDFAKASAYYNGTGNSNCGRSTYAWCPPAFTGADHIHAMSFFDGDVTCANDRSAQYCMYQIYCGDRQKCTTPVPWNNPGALTIAKVLGMQF